MLSSWRTAECVKAIHAVGPSRLAEVQSFSPPLEKGHPEMAQGHPSSLGIELSPASLPLPLNQFLPAVAAAAAAAIKMGAALTPGSHSPDLKCLNHHWNLALPSWPPPFLCSWRLHLPFLWQPSHVTCLSWRETRGKVVAISYLLPVS